MSQPEQIDKELKNLIPCGGNCGKLVKEDPVYKSETLCDDCHKLMSEMLKDGTFDK